MPDCVGPGGGVWTQMKSSANLSFNGLAGQDGARRGRGGDLQITAITIQRWVPGIQISERNLPALRNIVTCVAA